MHSNLVDYSNLIVELEERGNSDANIGGPKMDAGSGQRESGLYAVGVLELMQAAHALALGEERAVHGPLLGPVRRVLHASHSMPPAKQPMVRREYANIRFADITANDYSVIKT